MDAKHRKTLSAIFADPPQANILWDAVEAFFLALGATINEGSGSRTRVSLNGVHAVLHRPHPGKEVIKPAVRDIRRFLITAGIQEGKDE